jgi:hypothetical protein
VIKTLFFSMSILMNLYLHGRKESKFSLPIASHSDAIQES